MQGFTGGKCSRRRLVAERRIHSIARSIIHDGYTMIRALPIDVCGDSKVHPIGARYMSGSAYAATPIRWKESCQIPTIGRLIGEFTDMLREQEFRVIGVSADFGVEIVSIGQPDVVV